MSDLRSAADRFLERTETVDVRIPFDHEIAERYAALVSQRDRLLADYESEKEDYAKPAEDRTRRRTIGDPPPEKPDTTELDAAIDAADAEVDRNSIVVRLRFRPGILTAAQDWARDRGDGKDRLLTQMQTRITEGYFDGVLELVDGEWVETSMGWDALRGGLTDGELGALNAAAWELCSGSAATPFRKRSTPSAAN